MGNSISNQIAAKSQMDLIAMEDLIAVGGEWRYTNDDKNHGILRSVSGMTSVVSSSMMIWMILRSHDGLSTIQHRLLLGLCISDLISSSSLSTFNVMAPAEIDYYVWNAQGNEATCDAQGFVITMGTFAGLWYNASLNLYYLAVVKFEKREKYIRTRMEPLFHGVPIAGALAFSIALLVGGHYNSDAAGYCGGNKCHYPPHCHGYDVGEIRDGFEIPCGRGIEGADKAKFAITIAMFLPAIIMVGSLIVIYVAVKQHERKMSAYGVGSLRSISQHSLHSNTNQGSFNSGVWKRLRTTFTGSLYSLRSSSSINTSLTSRKKTQSQQSRAVMRKAFGYSFAWFLSFGMYIILVVLTLLGIDTTKALYVTHICLPLQGLFNLVIYLYPKVINARKKSMREGENISWCRALSRAFWSRGNRQLRRSRNRGKRGSRRRMMATNPQESSDRRTVRTLTMKKKPREEEKCEIEPPIDLSPYQKKTNTMHVPNLAPIMDSSHGVNKEATNVGDEENENHEVQKVISTNMNKDRHTIPQEGVAEGCEDLNTACVGQNPAISVDTVRDSMCLEEFLEEESDGCSNHLDNSRRASLEVKQSSKPH